MNANASGNTGRNHDTARREREYFLKTSLVHQQYMAQHCGPGSNEVVRFNSKIDLMGPAGLAKIAPMYKSGVNPNFYEEYFSFIEESDLTNTLACRTALWNEYQSLRWNYFTHLLGYHQGITQVNNRKVTTVELWRRLRGKPTPFVSDWYFDKDLRPGDILHRPSIPYTEGLSVLRANFANCPVPKQTLTFGSVHVAVGFVDLGILTDSRIIEPQDKNKSASLLLRGFEASPFSVAKSLVLWDMMCTTKTKACWVVQVWFSSVWSKKATNAFLAAARRVAEFECDVTSLKYPAEVKELVHHWAQSKGVGLKKLIERRSQKIRKEFSDALFFAGIDDRVEMIRYHLTGIFGLALAEEEPISGSITMFDCPNKASNTMDAHCVFHTLCLRDVVSSDLFNGSYFQTAEKVKGHRVRTLMDYIQAGRINIHLSAGSLSLESEAQVKEIRNLQPLSMSWSNILDYMPREEFHALASSCSSTAIHVGYSMNWPGVTHGASLIDYPDTSLSVIRKAEKVTSASMKKLCGQRRIFLTPIQHNPLNTTASLLAKECYKYWVRHFLLLSFPYYID